jgi:hypothetical protein
VNRSIASDEALTYTWIIATSITEKEISVEGILPQSMKPRGYNNTRVALWKGSRGILHPIPSASSRKHLENIGRQLREYEGVPYHKSIKGSCARLAKACRDRSETSHESISAYQLTGTKSCPVVLRRPATGNIVCAASKWCCSPASLYVD